MLADRLTWGHLETGFFYRWVAYHAINSGFNLDDPYNVFQSANAVTECATREPGSVSFRAELRTPEIGMAAAAVARHENVRAKLNAYFRSCAHENCGLVVDGRDAGAVIFPNADVKFFLEAPNYVRAKRSDIPAADLQRRDDLAKAVRPENAIDIWTQIWTPEQIVCGMAEHCTTAGLDT